MSNPQIKETIVIHKDRRFGSEKRSSSETTAPSSKALESENESLKARLIEVTFRLEMLEHELRRARAKR